MGNNLRKQPRLDDLPNEILFQILDLPNEILFQILSNLGKKNQMNVSLVNKRCYEASNYQIKDIRIRRPTNMDNLQGLQNFINRFPNLRNLSLASPVGNYLELLSLKSLELKEKTIEFDVRWDTLIKTKNWRNGQWHNAQGPTTYIRRIKVEDFENFAGFEYKPSQIIHFEVRYPEDLEKVKEEIMSFNSLRRIALKFRYNVMIPSGFFETILTRPALKQIDFHTSALDLDFDMEQEFTKNPMVEVITFQSDCIQKVPDLKKIQKLFDALPNIKRVRVVTFTHDIENLFVFLQMIGDFKKLESLHFAIGGLKKFDVQKIQDLLNIVKDFPSKAKVVIADIHSSNDFDDWPILVLENVIEKKEAKPPKKVEKSQSRYPLSGSSFEPEQM